MTVLFQCKLWFLPALFISQSPAHHRVYRDARSRARDRERGLSKLSGVDVLYMFILRDPIGSFSDWQRYGPARAHSGAPLLWKYRTRRSTIGPKILSSSLQAFLFSQISCFENRQTESGAHQGPVGLLGTLERFRAGHFTCKNTDWEKWREPIRKVEPETTDWALHTRILVRIEHSHFLTAAECWSIAGFEDTQSRIFYFSVSFFPFFFSLLFQEDDQI